MHTWRGHSISYFFLLFQGCHAVRFPIVMTGCGKRNNTFHIDVPHVNPKECLQRCNQNSVGIQNDTCYCGDFTPAAYPNLNCDQRCKWVEAGIDFSCGGNHFSVYKRGVHINEGMTDQSGCVLMHSDSDFRVENCSRSYSCMCDGDRFKEMVTTVTKNSWSQCGQSCIQSNNMFAFTEGKQYCLNRACNMDRWINAYFYNDCRPNPCRNNGTCTNTDFGFNCSCPSGVKGNTCEQVLNYSIIGNTAILPDSFVHPSNYETYSLSPSSTLTSAIMIDYSADQRPSVVTGICSQSVSSGSRFMLTVNTSAVSTPTVAIHLSSSNTSSSYVSSTTILPTISTLTSLESTINPSAASTPTEPAYLSSSITASSSVASTLMTPTVTPTPTARIHLSSSITASSSVTSSAMTPMASTAKTPTHTTSSQGSFLTSTPDVTLFPSAVTSNPNDAISGWFSDHAIIIFPICGAVVVLLAVTIIIICVKMRKMKRKNDELENENNDTPSNSEFDYRSSYSSVQRPENLYSSYHSGKYNYKEGTRMGPPQQMILPRVTIRPAGSFLRNNRDYEVHAFDGRPI